MPRVVRQAGLAAAPRSLSVPDALADPAIRHAVEQAAERAHALGVAEGEQRGRAHVEASSAALAASIEQATRVAAAASERVASELAARCDQIAMAAARALVGEVDAEVGGVLHRVRAALDVVDERPVVVHASSGDVALLAAVAGPGVEVVATEELLPGEARVAGRWAEADLTWAAVWASVQEALDA